MEKAKVCMLYDLFSSQCYKKGLDEGELEKTLRFVQGLKTAIESVKRDYPDLEMQVYIPEDSGAACGVYLNGYGQSVREAIVIYLKQAGLPYMVTSGCKIVDPFLADYGKTLRRKFYGLAVGKRVVNKK